MRGPKSVLYIFYDHVGYKGAGGPSFAPLVSVTYHQMVQESKEDKGS